MNEIMGKLTQARSDLILDEPFFGTLALRLKVVEDPTCDTFWTDGKHLGFNPEYADSLSMAEILGVVCEEVMHNACGHSWRRDGRDPKIWNDACDYAIIPIIRKAGMAMPDDSLDDPRFYGLSAEMIFSMIVKDKKSEDGKDGKDDQTSSGQGDKNTPKKKVGPGGRSEVRDAKGDDVETQEVEMKVAVLQAAQAAKAQGKLPAGIEKLVEQIRRTRIDWKAALRRFVQMCAKQDYTWRIPNKKFIGAGLYLPDLQSEQMPPVVIYWDTSGSMNAVQAECAAEAAAVIEECRPEKTYVVYGDAKVQRVEEFEAGEPIEFHPKGGGGTKFEPIFEWVQEQGIEPACFIGITDLMGSFPKETPDYPVIWVQPNGRRNAPFGDVIRLEDA